MILIATLWNHRDLLSKPVLKIENGEEKGMGAPDTQVAFKYVEDDFGKNLNNFCIFSNI